MSSETIIRGTSRPQKYQAIEVASRTDGQATGNLAEDDFQPRIPQRDSSGSGSLTFGKIDETGWEGFSFRRVEEDYAAIPLKVAGSMTSWTDWNVTTPHICPPTRTQRRQWHLCLFVSHPWRQKKFVDEKDKEGNLDLLPRITKMVRYVGHHVCQAMLCEARNNVYENAPKSMNRLFKRFSAFVRKAVAMMVADGASDTEILDHLQDNICVWIDYEVIPQKPHCKVCNTCALRRRTALASISSIARASLTILVGCDEIEGAKRGWILHETTVSLTSDTVFLWDETGGEIRPLNLVPHLHKLLDRSAAFTNKYDGRSLRIVQFAMLCLEPNCWFRHAELLFRTVGIPPGTDPTVSQWREAMQHPIHYQIRHENPFEQCLIDQDTRVLCRQQIEKLLQQGSRYDPDFTKIFEVELRSGLDVFPESWRESIILACELRQRLFSLCSEVIQSLMQQDRDARADFEAACHILVTMAEHMPQWRLFQGKVEIHTTDRYIRDEWLDRFRKPSNLGALSN